MKETIFKPANSRWPSIWCRWTSPGRPCSTETEGVDCMLWDRDSTISWWSNIFPGPKSVMFQVLSGATGRRGTQPSSSPTPASCLAKLEKGSASKETFHQNRTSAGWNWSQGGDLVQADRHNDHHLTHHPRQGAASLPCMDEQLISFKNYTRDAYLIL